MNIEIVNQCEVNRTDILEQAGFELAWSVHESVSMLLVRIGSATASYSVDTVQVCNLEQFEYSTCL